MNLNWDLSILKVLILVASVDAGIRSLAAAPDDPETRPLVSASAFSMICRSVCNSVPAVKDPETCGARNRSPGGLTRAGGQCENAGGGHRPDHQPGDRVCQTCTGFAILGLTIACVGLYGTVAYNVARRTGEIGIRMALGAQRGAVVRMILRQVFVLAAVGLAIGLPTALGASKLVESFLFGMKANDPRALTLAVAILLGAALLAGYVPARKAARIDPMTALRHE
jgi:ABC-type antimicrobial peptide transport system permease subunit